LFLDGSGGFHCNGCGAGGNVFQHEARFSSCTIAEAEAKVAEITGAKASFGTFQKLGPIVASYDYRAADGITLFQKRRYQPEGEAKTFRAYRPVEDGGWLAGIDPNDGRLTSRVLYNLPQLVTANMVLLCEGEKDCNNVGQLNLFEGAGYRIATTCNFDGAWKPGEKPKWLPSYNPYFAGKFVCIFQDNDESGEAFASHIAEAISGYAFKVKIVKLPGLPPKGDVSDWLETHTAKGLEAVIVKAPMWRPVTSERAYSMFEDMAEFAASTETTADWLVRDIIPRGANGIIGGDPKASKSFSALDIAMSIACGVPWMGFEVPRRAKVAVVSREDSAGLTQRRIKKLFAGRAEYLSLPDWALINTKRHQADFKVTTPEDMDALIEQLGRFGAEFVVLDVFRSLHDQEENSNTDVATVLDKISRIQKEAG
jgi:hypothetical protein